jgi:cytidine deaminase
VTRRDAVLALSAGALMGADIDPKFERILSDGRFRGRIQAAQVDALMRTEKLSREDLMIKLLPLAKRRAHPPLSNYYVGAVALGSSGNLYLGQNIEIPGNMLGLAVHAEQSAIANAYMSDEPGVKAIAVTAAPCGHCRQFLSEVSLDISILMPGLPAVALSELLPRAFGPKDLGMQHGAFPVKSRDLALASHSKDELVLAAWKAACGAYSPYTLSPSGAAIATSNGRIFAGSYIENAAFNPSLPPLETALAGYFAAGPGAGHIQKCVLVESSKAGISHQVTTRSVLTALAPGASFERMLLA